MKIGLGHRKFICIRRALFCTKNGRIVLKEDNQDIQKICQLIITTDFCLFMNFNYEEITDV